MTISFNVTRCAKVIPSNAFTLDFISSTIIIILFTSIYDKRLLWQFDSFHLFPQIPELMAQFTVIRYINGVSKTTTDIPVLI